MKSPLLNESCCLKTYVKAWYCAWYDMRFVWISSTLSGDVHTLVSAFWLSRQEWRESFHFAIHFIMLLWSCHLAATRSTILESKRCNLYKSLSSKLNSPFLEFQKQFICTATNQTHYLGFINHFLYICCCIAQIEKEPNAKWNKYYIIKKILSIVDRSL